MDATCAAFATSSSLGTRSDSPIDKVLSFLSHEQLKKILPAQSRTECAITIEVSLEVARLKNLLTLASSQGRCMLILREVTDKLSHCPPSVYQPIRLCTASIQSLSDPKIKSTDEEINQSLIRIYGHSISLAQFSEKNFAVYEELHQSGSADVAIEIAERKKAAAEFQLNLSALLRETVLLAQVDS